MRVVGQDQRAERDGIDRQARWRFFLLIAPLCWIIYANSLGNDFVFDDLFTVVNNRTVLNFTFSRLLTDWFRPLRDLSLAIDYWLWGLHPSGFRLTNILLHSFNSFLVFLVALEVLRAPRAALMASLFFAVHPVQTEAVAYISGRRDVLFTFFYLLGFYSFMRFRQTGIKKYAGVALTAFVLSAMTKEMAVTLPLIVLLWELYERWPSPVRGRILRHFFDHTRAVLKANRWVLAGAVLVFVGLAIRYTVEGRGLGTSRALQLDYWGGSIWHNVLTVLTVHAHYLKLLVAPVTLVASYQGAFPIATSLLEGRVLLAILVLAVPLSLMMYGLFREKQIAFAWAFYFIALLPVSQIIPHHELLAEHYLYLPMFGFSLLVGHLFWRLSQRQRIWRKLALSGFAIILIVFGARTVVRNRDWKNGLTLWRATYQAVPTSPRAAYNLGVEYSRRQKLDQAIFYFRRAIELNPSHILAYNNLAAALLATGDAQEALTVLRRALKLNPTRDPTIWGRRLSIYRMLYRNMAKCYLRLGQPGKALEAAERALDQKGGDAASFILLAQIYVRLHRLDDAIKACQRGLDMFPTAEELHAELADLLVASGRIEEAVPHWQAILEKNPTHPPANIHLALRAIDQGDRESASRHLQQALRASVPEEQLHALLAEAASAYSPPRSFHLLADAYEMIDQLSRAISVCREGLEQYPQDRDLRLKLALLYVKEQKLDDAARQWQQVIAESPTDFLANLNLGIYYLSKGDMERGRTHLTLALEHAPNEAGRQQVRDILQRLKEPRPSSSSVDGR